jgi:hypothetical protein
MSSLRDEILRVCEGHCLRTGTSMDALSRRALGGDHHAIPNLRCGGWSGCSTTSPRRSAVGLRPAGRPTMGDTPDADSPS